MPLLPQRIINTVALQPAQNAHLATQIAVRLPGGVNYPRGSVLGEVQVALRNEVQTITLGTATGGTYRLLYNDGTQTASLAFNANAAAIQAALQATTAFGPGSVVVSGAGPFVLTWSGIEYRSRELTLPQIISALTGGTTHTIAQTTTGSAGPTGCYAIYNAGRSDGAQTGRVLLTRDAITDLRGCRITEFGMNDEITFSAYQRGDFLASDIVNLDATNLAQIGKLISGAAFSTVGALVRVQ